MLPPLLHPKVPLTRTEEGLVIWGQKASRNKDDQSAIIQKDNQAKFERLSDVKVCFVRSRAGQRDSLEDVGKSLQEPGILEKK